MSSGRPCGSEARRRPSTLWTLASGTDRRGGGGTEWVPMEHRSVETRLRAVQGITSTTQRCRHMRCRNVCV